MSPGSVDAAVSGTDALDASADEIDPILEAVNKLGPGDMVFAKFARYPWWPAIIVPCNQRRHKHADLYRVGGDDPKLAKFWVQFFNENSGAFVLLKNVFPFNPLELDKYACPKSNSHFLDQQKAFVMARDDFYVLNPDFPRRGDEAITAAPDEDADTADVDSEGNASVAQKKAGRPAKRKPTKSASAKAVKTKRARIAKPDAQEFGSVSSESGEEADSESVPIVVSEEIENSNEANDGSAGEAGDSDEAIVAPPKPKKSPKVTSAKSSGKALALKDAKKKKGIAADKQMIRSLQRLVKSVRADLEEEQKVHDASRKRNKDLERKLKKARHLQKSAEKVKVLLPEVADALPEEIPLESERVSKKLDAGEFQTLGAQTHSVFSEYEALVKECGGLHNAVLAAAKKAEAQLQSSWDEMASSMRNMENLERKLAGLLRTLYCADIRSDNGPDEAVMLTVTKIVKRIYRRVRVGDNSGLVLGRAHAVIESWETEASKMRPPAEACGKETTDNANLSGVSPDTNWTSEKVASEGAIDAKDPKTPSKDIVDGHVETKKKEPSSSDDRTQVVRRPKKEPGVKEESEVEEESASPQEGNDKPKEDRDDEQRDDGMEAPANTGETDEEGKESADSGGEENGRGDIDESAASPKTAGEDGDGDEKDAMITVGKKKVSSNSPSEKKPSASSDAMEEGDGE